MNTKYILSLIVVFMLAFATNGVTQCFDNGHSPFQGQSWKSCNTSIGPIPERGDRHWIMYDLGALYSVDSFYIWNHNVWGETGAGVKEILIDISTNQNNWTTAGPFTIDRAPGSWKYTGVPGPVLDELHARYVLITVLETWDETSDCAGLSEIKFRANLISSNEEIPETGEWALYPNPAEDQITLDLPDSGEITSVLLYNSIGQVVTSYQVDNQYTIKIPVSHLENGMYFITIQSETAKDSKPFIKVK